MTPTQSSDPASRKSKALARTASQISPHPLGATDRTPDAINEFLFDGILTPLPPSPTPRPQKRMKPALKSASSTNSRPSVSASVSFSEPERRAVDADVEEGAGSSSDPDDDPSGNYTPNTTHNFRRPRTIVSESTSALKPSPKKRRNHKSSVATSAKRLVTAADPNKAICLLTNAPEPTKSRQFCHVIPRSISDAILTLLEWWWQLPYWTLYIDTHFNILALMSNWHLSMDGADWTLVPHHSLIAAILAWVTKVTVHDVTGYNENKRFPISQLYNQQTEFQYFFLALTEEMKDVAIHRYATDVESDFDPKAFETHFHPFDTIGALTSHIQPHFVVFSAGQKLAEIASSKTADDFDDFVGNLALTTSFGHEGEPAEVIEANIHSLEDIISIHKAWSSSIHVPKLTDTPRSSWMVRPEGCEETVKVKK